MFYKQFIFEKQSKNNLVKTIILIALLAGLFLIPMGYFGYSIYYNACGIIVAGVIFGITFPIILLNAKSAILKLTNGREADPANPRERALISIVKDLQKRAELPIMPKVFILPTDAPNACATGLSYKSAIVCVTQGLLDCMDGDELKGVIAHELAHIRSRDILVCQVVTAISATMMFFAFYLPLGVAVTNGQDARYEQGEERKEKANNAILWLLVALVLGAITKLITILVEMGISRKREYAADAHAALLCGSPYGLADALEKLKKYEYSEKDVNALGGSSLRSLYITFPCKFSIFSTHPPIEKRIHFLRFGTTNLKVNRAFEGRSPYNDQADKTVDSRNVLWKIGTASLGVLCLVLLLWQSKLFQTAKIASSPKNVYTTQSSSESTAWTSDTNANSPVSGSSSNDSGAAVFPYNGADSESTSETSESDSTDSANSSSYFSSMAPVSGYQTYTNDRYYYSVDYPNTFLPGRAPDDDDGLTWFSSDGKAKLIVSGSYNVLNQTPAAYFEQLLDESSNISYRVQKENWCIISGTNTDRTAIYYEKVVIGYNQIDTMRLTYPVSQKQQYDGTVTHISTSFQTPYADEMQ